MTTPTHDHQDSAGASPTRSQRTLIVVIAVSLGLVVLAPIALSSQHIYEWARDPMGLGLGVLFAVLAFVALDLAATLCVSMTVYSGLRGEGAGIFGLLTWVFAGGSAWINWQSAETTASPLDGPFFAAMSIAGPVLLEATLARVRKWTRQAAGTQVSAHPRFGIRWLVSPGETLSAWAASRRENIARPELAIAYVRERAALASMSDVDAIRYAWSAMGSYDEYNARLWLQARGRTVTQAAMDEATADRPRTPLQATQIRPILPPVPPDDDPDGRPVPVETDPLAADRAMLATLGSKRDMIRHAFAVRGDYDVPGAVSWLAERGVTITKSDAYAVRKAEQENARAMLRALPSQRA
ncbi:hypothetical protein GCM10010156_76000 [Planobispora rosea]|uniref:Uncharacterized protein n=1 Tax=Planobispora rosea TaxID=35762 RepID=Q2MLT0_PLARO|nr:DUF2637 domain-containing protein [Planobispora rosea]ABC59132.1 hypothetical protein pPR2.8 [Planobispora rosea]GGT07565.1 hypothetical protein GCM10010156_76000 [Planobispora rosea]GIH89218.1 hypothetical protein Pro02_76260 [Planobispora rosea]